MSKILSLDDMLEAANESQLPEGPAFVAELEVVATRLAVALADHLKIRMTHGGDWQGEAFGGLCANFGPATPGQKCPDVIDSGDPSGDWEVVGDYYPDHRCPDCHELIPMDTAFGDACSNCSHVFNLPALNDDQVPAEYVTAAKTVFPGRQVLFRNTPEGWEALVGPEGEKCYAVVVLQNSIDFERRD